MILVDSGSNHSFLDAKLAKELKVPIVSVPIASVKVADGRKIFSTEKAPGFTWKIHRWPFQFDLWLLPLRGFNMDQ